jgi:PAS domain S-box-containing protein
LNITCEQKATKWSSHSEEFAVKKAKTGLPVQPVPVRELNLRDVLRKIDLTESSSPSVLINQKFEILYFHGDTGRYLTPPVGEPVFNLLKMAREDLRPGLLTALDECTRERRPAGIREVTLKDQDAGDFVVDLAVRPLAGEGLPPDLFLVAFEDKSPVQIQAKKRGEAGEAEIRWLASFPRLNVNPVLEMDLTGTITFCNQAAFAAVQPGGGAAGPEAFLPEDLEYILIAVLEQPEEVFYREVRVKDGVYAENIAYVEPFKVIRIYATDITARKRFEEALRTANAQLSALIENSPLALMRLDEEGTILSCNPAGERMFGWSAAELVGQKIPFVPADELEVVRDVLRRVSQGERFVGIERRRLRKDGSVIDLSVSVAPMYDEAGTFTGIVSLLEDITPRKEAEAARRRSNQRLDLLAETASRLLASASPQQEVEGLCQEVMAFLGCEVFFHCIADETRGCLHLSAYAGIPAAEAKRNEWVDYGEAVCGCAAREGHRIVTEHVQTRVDPRTELVKSYGIQAYACHPLVVEGRVLGTLSFGARNRSKFSDNDLALMKAVADQVAIAMDRKKAEATLRRANDELEQRVRERTAELRRTVEHLQLEVEERLITEEMLRQSEARFLAAFDQSHVGAVIVDQDLRFQRVNPAFCRIIGYTFDELASMSVVDISHPDDRAKNLEAARRFLACETNYIRMEERNIRKDGAVIWIDLGVSAISPGSRPGYFLGIVQDITARKTAEKALAQHAALVRDLYDNAPCGYHSLDPAGRFVQVNNTELAWLGYTREEMLGGMHFTDLLTPASRGTFRKNFAGFKERGWVRDLEYELIRKDGTILAVLLNATAVKDEAGHYLMSRSTMVDITERRRVQEALKAERRRFFDMLEKIPAYVVLIGPDCTIPYANREFVRRFGDPGNRRCYEFSFRNDAPLEDCKALEVFKTKTPQTWEWTGPDGSTFQVHDHPFTDVDGSPLILELGVDISGLKAAEAGILRQSAILSAINRVFREFLICKTEEELGRTCLTIAEELTGSRFGFIGEVNQAGHLDITAFSDPGWAACQMGEAGQERVKLFNLGMRGLIGEVITEGRAVIANDPATYSGAAGLPPGHPPLTSYLGAPLRHGGQVFGLIALANKPGGYTQADQEAVETLSVAIVEGLMRFRAETRVVIVSRLYLLLSQVNEAIVRARDQAALFQEVCRIAVEEGRFKMAWVGLVDAQDDAVKDVARYGLEEGYLERIIISFREGPESLGPTGTAVRENRPDICNDIANDPRMALWREEALKRGYRSSGSFPLRVGGKVVGSLAMYAGQPGFFTDEEVRLLESLAHDISFAMESLERDARRRQTEAALKASEERLRDLTSRLINAQEAERKRLAIELHDDLGQSLMVLKLQVRQIEKKVPGDQRQIREHCTQALNYINEVVENVRRLSRDLMPPVLQDLGLGVAVKLILENFCKLHELECSWQIDAIQGLLAAEQEVMIYRIFQESLTNISRHAHATRVTVAIRKIPGAIRFSIEDNGVGVDLQNFSGQNLLEAGLGLASIEERARMVNGSLEIWSQEGQGTRITLVVPLGAKVV